MSRPRYAPLAAALALLVALLALPTSAHGSSEESEPVGPASTFETLVYGIDDDNVIWENDPVLKTLTQVNATEITGTSNSMAYDRERDHFFFINESPEGVLTLRWWDRLSTGPTSVPVVATAAQLGDIPGNPNNAAFHDDGFWFITNQQTTLNKVEFTYDDPSGIAFSQLITYDLATYTPAFPSGGGGYGDIAITTAGMLYGQTANGRFFSVDLTVLDDPTSSPYTEIKAPDELGSVQLSFNSTEDILYGQREPTGEWFSVDTATGGLTSIDFTTIVGEERGFRDLAGPAFDNAPQTCSILDPDNTNNQSAAASMPVGNDLTALVVDYNDEPVSRIPLTFEITAGGGYFLDDGEEVQEVVVITGTDGIATAPPWVLGEEPGENTVVASVGTLCEETFIATATTPAPAISLTKVPSGSPPTAVGDVVSWTMVATNTGNVTLFDPRVSDPWVEDRGFLECGPIIVPLEPGDFLFCTGVYTVTQADLDAGAIVNTATATGTDFAGTTVQSSDTATVPLAQNPAGSIVKALTSYEDVNGNGLADAGDRLSWRVVATNDGNVTLTEMLVVDDLTGDEILCPVVAPTETCAMTTTHTVTQEEAASGRVTNVATVVATAPGGEQLTGEVSTTVPLDSPAPEPPPAENPAAAQLPQTGGVSFLQTGLVLLSGGALLLFARRRLFPHTA